MNPFKIEPDSHCRYYHVPVQKSVVSQRKESRDDRLSSMEDEWNSNFDMQADLSDDDVKTAHHIAISRQQSHQNLTLKNSLNGDLANLSTFKIRKLG